MTKCRLRGITWNHSRALPPLVATAQRYEELNPGVQIAWEKRTLHEFGHANLAQLAERYDLLVVDHPMMGEAGASLVDLVSRLQADDMERLRQDYVGPSFASYEYSGTLYALPIDAAAPAASFRADLLDQAGLRAPDTWSDLLDLARRGKVRMPGFPADLFLNWMGMCISRGSYCAGDPEHLFRRETAATCLKELRELASSMPAIIYEWNPIAMYEAMSRQDDFAYCPFAYTYSNYSRQGFGAHPLQFAGPVTLADGTPLRTVLGGTGIAVSKTCAHPEEALRYSLFVAEPEVQRDLYGPTGGQPAARSAWEDPVLNRLSGDFFTNTRHSIETACVRPRYSGYISLQEQGGIHVAQYLQGRMTAAAALDAVDRLYRDSLKLNHASRPASEAGRHA